MSARAQQVLTTILVSLIAILNGTLGWHIGSTAVVALVMAGVGLVLAIAHVEASGGSLAQDWQEIKPALQAFLTTASVATSASLPAARAAAVQPEQTSAGLPTPPPQA